MTTPTVRPIRHPSPTDRLTVELGVMDAMVDIHRATDADSMRAAFRAARTAMAPALEALDRECALASVLAQCEPCVGEGVITVNAYGSGEDALEETCEACGGTGQVQP